jgi:hypothetical protein
MYVYDTPDKIELFKLSCLVKALELQAKGVPLGMLGRLPRTPLQVLAKDYGVRCRTSKKGVVEARKLLEAHRLSMMYKMNGAS